MATIAPCCTYTRKPGNCSSLGRQGYVLSHSSLEDPLFKFCSFASWHPYDQNKYLDQHSEGFASSQVGQSACPERVQ